MSCWVSQWLAITTIVSAIPSSNGYGFLTPPKSYPSLINDEMNDVMGNMKACMECRRILSRVRNSILSPNERINHSDGSSFNRTQSLKDFCTSYLIPMDSGTCDLIANHFLQAMQNETYIGNLRDICNASGVCGVHQTTTISKGEELKSDTSYRDANRAASQAIFKLPLPKPTVGARLGFTDWILNLFGRGNEQASSSSSPITFVQISDIHLDHYYDQGSANTCRDKICCRKTTKGSGSAGRFGDYRCDSVKNTVDAILDSIAQLDPQPDFFVYVGDSPPHSNGRDETLSKKLEDNKAVNDVLREKLRAIGPIYPTLGNHDMFPENLYFSKGTNTKAILKVMATEWSDLFPLDGKQEENIQGHGYYTTLIKEGLRIISMNSLYAYRLNPVALLFALDPAARQQYQFIRKTLEDARTNNEKVIIMSHMKPSHFNTYALYTISMEQLVKEFQDTIILMLYGHEHTDTFVLSTDPLDRKKATGTFLAAPSITPYIYYKLGTNPSYRVYSLDRNTLQPLDYVQYYVDLENANDNNELIVKKHYRFTEEYNVPDLKPSSFKTVADRISNDWGYYQKFERNKDVLVRRRKQCPRWNIYCRLKLTCETTAPTKVRFQSCLLNPFK